jgi:hypothetical protein
MIKELETMCTLDNNVVAFEGGCELLTREDGAIHDGETNHYPQQFGFDNEYCDDDEMDRLVLAAEAQASLAPDRKVSLRLKQRKDESSIDDGADKVDAEPSTQEDVQVPHMANVEENYVKTSDDSNTSESKAEMQPRPAAERASTSDIDSMFTVVSGRNDNIVADDAPLSLSTIDDDLSTPSIDLFMQLRGVAPKPVSTTPISMSCSCHFMCPIL